MLKLVTSTMDTIYIEKEIMDSDPYYNMVSHGTPDCSLQTVIDEHEEMKKMDKDRYLVMKNDEYVAIIDFTMCNPKDDTPWIGLLMVHSKYQGTRLSYEVYHLLESMMIEKGAKKIRLGCYKANEKGQAFWARQSYFFYKTVTFNDRPLHCLEKTL